MNLLSKTITLFCLLYSFLALGNNPDGQYDVRVVVDEIDQVNSKMYVIVEVKATDATSNFNIADQNYRLSYNRMALANPTIAEELELSDIVVQTGGTPTTSFYAEHTLTGTLDTVISYNIELSGGDGYYLSHTDYTQVGKLGFDILNLNACYDIWWHSQAPLDFPPTVIINKWAGNFDSANEGNYISAFGCFQGTGSSAPIASDDFYTSFTELPSNLDVFFNDFDNLGLDLSSTQNINNPTNGELVNNGDGTFTYTSNPSFVGVDSFEYEICNIGTPALCDTALVEINVQTSSSASDIKAINDFVSVDMDSILLIDVLANDFAASGEIDSASLAITNGPDEGTATIVDNKIEYVGNPGYYGEENINYTICAKNDPTVCDDALIRISVNNPAGKYDLRIVVDEIDEINSKMYVIVEVKATDEDNTFHISDQNHRLSFNRDALWNPAIEEEYLSGFVAQSGGTPTTSFYLPHTLTGSLDTVISYNVGLSGGDGYLLSHTEYTSIGRLSFDIVDLNGCYDIWWHDKDPAQFPPTFIGKKWNGVLGSAEEGNYQDAVGCFIENITDVWPGDTDNNTIVNNFDVLNLGIGLGTTGPIRQNATTDWQAQPANDWAQSTPLSNLNYKHVDTDGNGQITLEDTTAIILNWGQFYNPAGFAPMDGDIPFFISAGTANPGETIEVPVMLGDVDNPVVDAYGLAFTINYDENMVHPAEAVLIFDDSWLGDEGTNMFQLQRNFELDGRLEVGLSRMDGNPISGHGQIGILQLTIKDDVLVDLKNEDLPLAIENVRLQRFNEEEILTDPQTSFISITNDPVNTRDITGLEMSVRPNPATDLLHIINLEQSVDYIEIVNMIGQSVFVQENVQGNLQVDVSKWNFGIYTVRATKGQATYVEKILVVK